MEIKNTTKRALRIPLPGGKFLSLGPGKSGQINPKASEHPPVQKLVEEGEIEIVGGGRSKLSGGSDGKSGKGSSQTGGGSPGVRHTGDR